MQGKRCHATIIAPALAGFLAFAAGGGPAAAQAGSAGIYGPGGISALTVALGCRVESEKVLAITNTGAVVIPVGTAITYDAKRKPDYGHYGRTFKIGTALSPGAAVRIGGIPSFSCTASFRRTLTTAPSPG
jgi:hypothetical protein